VTTTTLSAAARAANPMHCGTCAPDVAWSTSNASEALPGVATPMTWSFFGDNVEIAFRGAFCDVGVLRRQDVVAPARTEDRMWDVFFGRAAANLNTFRWLADKTPGTGGNAIEQQIFATVRPGMVDAPDRGRYPIVAVKMPLSALRLTKQLRASTADILPWWQHAVGPGAPTTKAQAQALLRDASARHRAVMRPHTLAAMLCQALYEQIRVLAEKAGRPGLETSLVTGYGDMAETEVVSDLWAVSRDRLTLDEFVVRHGFHGPNEGELAALTWRLRRDPLERLVTAYRGMDDDRDPRRVEAQRGEERRSAEAELLAALPRARRAPARAVLGVAAKLIPLRGVGKAGFLRCCDAARTAARAYGDELVAAGVLEDVEDVFLLTMPELLVPEPAPGTTALVAERRAIRAEYRSVENPDYFEGVPVPQPLVVPEASEATVVTGIAVGGATVEGIARLIVDPEGDDELEDGEILVCRTTDPSWASLMMVASALVIDIGGPISHGAIVARELGIPCVIGTRTGSAIIRTGDRLRVDGTSGEVRILERAG
jgi:phosphohistidine swiveling domain-containing protein